MLQFKHNPKSDLLKWRKEDTCIKEQNLLKSWMFELLFMVGSEHWLTQDWHVLQKKEKFVLYYPHSANNCFLCKNSKIFQKLKNFSFFIRLFFFLKKMKAWKWKIILKPMSL